MCLSFVVIMTLLSSSEALDYIETYADTVRHTVTFLEQYVDEHFGDQDTQIPGQSEGKKRSLVAMVLGSGLDKVDQKIGVRLDIPYKDIPGWPATTVEGHAGKLTLGWLERQPIIFLSGRTHYYEVGNQPMNVGPLQVTFPVNVLAELGVPLLFMTNAAGGLNENYNAGDIMVLDDHVKWNLPDPLIGEVPDLKTIQGEPVLRFPDNKNAYDAELSNLLYEIGDVDFPGKINIGTYVAVSGPSYETLAEIEMYRQVGDAIGMSTVMEVITARWRGMDVVALSLITNKLPTSKEIKEGTASMAPLEHTEVLETGKDWRVQQRLRELVQEFLIRYPGTDAYKRHHEIAYQE